MTKREFCHIWCIDRIYSGVYNMVKLMKSLNYKYDWMKILVRLFWGHLCMQPIATCLTENNRSDRFFVTKIGKK